MQVMTAGSNTRLIEAFGKLLSINWVPSPVRSGLDDAGPPDSRQMRANVADDVLLLAA